MVKHKHQFVDALLSEAIRPYERIANIQRVMIKSIVKQLEEEAHRKKEDIVERVKETLARNEV